MMKRNKPEPFALKPETIFMTDEFVEAVGLVMKPKVKKPSPEEKQEAESWPIWEKEESTFPWEYDEQETCLILKGKAAIKCPEGIIEFGVGDYVIFPQGLKCTWEVKNKIKKHYKFG